MVIFRFDLSHNRFLRRTNRTEYVCSYNVYIRCRTQSKKSSTRPRRIPYDDENDENKNATGNSGINFKNFNIINSVLPFAPFYTGIELMQVIKEFRRHWCALYIGIFFAQISSKAVMTGHQQIPLLIVSAMFSQQEFARCWVIMIIIYRDILLQSFIRRGLIERISINLHKQRMPIYKICSAINDSN